MEKVQVLSSSSSCASVICKNVNTTHTHSTVYKEHKSEQGDINVPLNALHTYNIRYIVSFPDNGPVERAQLKQNLSSAKARHFLSLVKHRIHQTQRKLMIHTYHSNSATNHFVLTQNHSQ